MANPRKFSEKIALHNQKQAEETAAFEEIMREVMGATRTPTPYNSNQLHITPSFNVTRAGSLPNVNQIGQHNAAEGKNAGQETGIDLQGCLNNLEEIKSGCLERSGSVRAESSSRRNFSNATHQKRSQSPYSTNAYLSPPPPDGHWRRTNSDSALHQSSTHSATTNHQPLDGFNQLIGNNGAFNGATNGSPRRSAAMVIDNSATMLFSNTDSNSNGSPLEWDKNSNSPTDKFLLSASLPDQQLRPRSCEVPGINIYPSQDDNNPELVNHHHIPISSNTGSLPDLTNLHFPVPLHAIDGEDQNAANGLQGMMGCGGGGSTSPYSNGPDSPFSPTSSHNSNLSPPPPCNMMGNYSTSPGTQSPRRQTSPGPSPSPTSTRRRAQHQQVNNLVIGNLRHQPQPLQAQSQGLALDTSALSLNSTGNGVQYKGMNNQNSNSETLLSNASCGSPFQQQQFHFTNTQSFQNFAMTMHRSTTPTDSCSAPTSPASQNISPSNSPELPNNSNGANVNLATQQFNNSYTAYSNQQANLLQHQLEQFRMTSESDPATYMMSCGSDLASPLQSSGNAFYLDSLNCGNLPLQQYTDPVISQSNSNDMPSSPHQIASHNVTFATNENVYFSSSQMSPLGSQVNNDSNVYKNDILTSMSMSNLYSNQPQQLSNSSLCTTPQTPSSIPDIILTGPNNLDELQSTTDFVKDLNSSMINTSFDSDIFCSASDELRTGTFDSFDLDNLPILSDIDTPDGQPLA